MLRLIIFAFRGMNVRLVFKERIETILIHVIDAIWLSFHWIGDIEMRLFVSHQILKIMGGICGRSADEF